MLIIQSATLTDKVATEHVAVDVNGEAKRHIELGRAVVSIPTGEKRPLTKGWQNLRLTTDDVDYVFGGKNQNIGLILGESSGWLVDVDLDCEEAVRLAPEYLPATEAVTGRTGQPGRHWWYISENCKHDPHRDRFVEDCKQATTVELRSTGHQTVIGPSIHPDGTQYDTLQGAPAVVSAEKLTAAVLALHTAVMRERGHDGDEDVERPTQSPPRSSAGVSAVPVRSLRPGDDYNERGDLHALLVQHGWTVFGKSGNNVQLTRPGKTSGLSATWNGEHFYVFSSSCPQFEPEKGYRPFEVYTRLEHNGDHTRAAAQLGMEGFGSASVDRSGIDLSGILSTIGATAKSQTSDTQSGSQGMGGIPAEPKIEKRKAPVEFPPHLLKVPGFVGQVTQYMLSTAKKPQPLLSMWAALCLQATLCGRKIRDPFGGRTNLYVINLAESGNGKDHPRVMNRKILASAGLLEHEGPEDIASDSGLLAAVAHQPALIMHLDEVGRLLKSCAAAGSGSSHLYNITTLLLRLYSSAGGMYKGKAYGDRAKNIEIDQPCLTIYGSTVPASFWGSMSSESIGDGFLARMIPVIGDEHPPSHLPHEEPVPESILMHAQGWGAYRPTGILGSVHPGPTVVDYTVEAEEILTSWRHKWEQKANDSNEWRPVWVRAAEKACRLALVYVASRGTKALRIDAEAITWACEVSEYTTSLFEIEGDQHIADSEFERWCQSAQRRIEAAGVGGVTFARLCNFAPFRSLDLRQSQLVLDKLKAADAIHTKINRKGGVTCYWGPINEPDSIYDESTQGGS